VRWPERWAEIVGRAINRNAESIEVGVHRGLRVDGAFLRTADFDLSASSPFTTGIPVESIISALKGAKESADN
jgi:hypothetical protein